MSLLSSFLSRSPLRLCAALLAAATALSARADLDPAAAPAANFDLSQWKLTLPVDAAGGVTGKAAEVMPSQLTAAPGYSSSWFYSEADGSMAFWAPHNGARTGGAKYPRSELREMLDPNDDGVNWTIATNSVLIATLRVTQVPNTGKIVIGQIHGYGPGPLIKVQYEYSASTKTGKVVALINAVPDASDPMRYTLASNVKLGARFSYQIKVWNSRGVSTLSATVNSGAGVSWPINAAWGGVPMYFKAGSYPQEAGSSATVGGAVQFYVLAASHPDGGLKISTTRLPDALLSGGLYQQQLGASGGAGGYRWSLASGQLPQGLTLSPDGLISGVPDALLKAGVTHTLAVKVTDADNNTAARTLKILVAL